MSNQKNDVDSISYLNKRNTNTSTPNLTLNNNNYNLYNRNSNISTPNTNKDFNKTVTDVKLGYKGVEVKKKKSLGPSNNIGIGGGDNSNTQENNLNSRMTGNTVTNPGEGLSEHFDINTIGANNFSS